MSDISSDNRLFIDTLRGASILRVVLAHLGLSWIYQPYSGYVLVFLPVLFFVSGAVSYGSFMRQPSVGKYLLNRYLTVSVPYYLYVMFSFLIFWLYESRYPSFDHVAILQYLTFNAVGMSDISPMPVAHIWFLHSLLFIMIISFFIFIFSKNKPVFLLIGVVFSLLLGIFQSFYNIGPQFRIFNHNFYQPLSNLGFFMFGAFYFLNIEKFNRKVNFFSFFIVILITLLFAYFIVDDYRIAEHFYYPDLFFMLCCYSAILLVLLFKDLILYFVKHFNILKSFLLFMNKNSYSVYLLHVFVIYTLSYKFELMGLGGDPSRAFLKVFMAILITCIFAVPFTVFTRGITLFLRERVVGTSK